MDFYGIGQGVEGSARIYFMSGRRTGRTISLIHSLKEGDRVVFANSKEANRFDRLCKERDVEIVCVVIDPRNPGSLFERGSSQGRTIFDHTWVEEYYLNTLRRCQDDIDHFERESSGYGEAHIQTKLKAQELAKWRI